MSTMRTEIQQQVQCLCASLKTQALSSGAVLLIFFVSRNRPAAMLHNSLHPSNGTETNHQDIQVSSHSKFKESCTSSENSQQRTAASATASAANASSAAYSPIPSSVATSSTVETAKKREKKKSKKRIFTPFMEAICDAMPPQQVPSEEQFEALVDQWQQTGRLPTHATNPFASDSDDDNDNHGGSSHARPAKKAKVTTSKKSKKPIDPNAPKKNVSSYMHFCKEKRKQVKEDYPDLATSEIGSKLGELWRALSDKDKTKYVKQAEADKTRYQTEMKSYEPTMT